VINWGKIFWWINVVITLLLIATCIHMIIDYWGMDMFLPWLVAPWMIYVSLRMVIMLFNDFPWKT